MSARGERVEEGIVESWIEEKTEKSPSTSNMTWAGPVTSVSKEEEKPWIQGAKKGMRCGDEEESSRRTSKIC